MAKQPSQQDIDRFQRASQALQTGNPAEALGLFEQLRKAWGHSADLWYLTGVAHGMLGDMAAAETASRQAVEINPAHVGALCNLANARSALGKAELALSSYERAIRLDAGNPNLVENYAIALNSLGRHREAADLLEDLVAGHPAQASAWSALGAALTQCGQTGRAMAAFRAALEHAPALAPAHVGLGDLHRARLELAAAAGHYQAAVDADPANVAAHIGLATCRLQAGAHADALDRIDQALKQLPGDPQLLGTRADILEHSGEHRAAYDILDALRSADRLDATGICAFANLCHRYGAEATAVTLVERALAATATTRQAQKLLHFAAGKLLDRMQRFDEAFSHYHAANETNKPAFDAESANRIAEDILRHFTEQDVARYARASTASSRPVFIVGMPRSGTTLVEQILASHADVYGAGELGDITRISVELGSGDLEEVGAYASRLEQLDEQRLTACAQGYLDRIAALDATARHVTDKMPHNYQHLGLVNLLFPNARVIHCVRDPLDTILSIYFQNFTDHHAYASDLQDIATVYQIQNRMMDHWKQVLDMPILTIAYEDVVAGQEACSRQLLDFCGLDWDEAVMRFYENRRNVNTVSYDQVNQPVYTRSVGRWRHYREHLAGVIDMLVTAGLYDALPAAKQPTTSSH